MGQKKNVHNELIDILEKYKTLHEEMLEHGKTAHLEGIQNKQKEIEKYKMVMDEFVKKFLLQES